MVAAVSRRIWKSDFISPIFFVERKKIAPKQLLPLFFCSRE